LLFFQIIIEGIRGTGFTGDIAVDDFKFKIGSCSILPASAKPSTPTTQVAQPLTTNPPTTPPCKS
jgi:hypothetical protein